MNSSSCWRPVTTSIHSMLRRARIPAKNRFGTAAISQSEPFRRWLAIEIGGCGDNRFHNRQDLRRHSSSSSTDDQLILLYRREESRNMIPRSLFLFSTFNTSYWVWYVTDFVPAISAAELQVDASWGYVGLGIGLVSNLVVGLYGTSLVSTISYDPKHNNLLVSKHTLPLLRGSAKAKKYKVGDLMIESSSNDKMKIFEHGIENFQGHLSLKSVLATSGRRYINYSPLLLEIRQPSEINTNPNLMTDLLLLQGNNSTTISSKRTTTPRRKKKIRSKEGNEEDEIQEQQEYQKQLKWKKQRRSKRQGNGRR